MLEHLRYGSTATLEALFGSSGLVRSNSDGPSCFDELCELYSRPRAASQHSQRFDIIGNQQLPIPETSGS